MACVTFQMALFTALVTDYQNDKFAYILWIALNIRLVFV